MFNKIAITLVAVIVVSFLIWIIASEERFEKSCFEAGGISARISGEKYCIPKNTEYLMKY